MMVLKFSEAAAEIIGIAVSEKLRRRGIGKQLILSAMELEGIGRIEVQTDDDSIGFYRRCGFSESAPQRRPPFLLHPAEFILLRTFHMSAPFSVLWIRRHSCCHDLTQRGTEPRVFR